MARAFDEAAQRRLEAARRLREDTAARGIAPTSGAVWGQLVSILGSHAEEHALAVARIWHDAIVATGEVYGDQAHHFVLSELASLGKPSSPIETEFGLLPHELEGRIAVAADRSRRLATNWLEERLLEGRLRSRAATPSEPSEAPEYIDGGTGLLNKAALLAALPTEITQSRATAEPLSVLMIDLDEFKAINTTWGHVRADDALREFGTRVATVCRSKGTAYRFGGDEFAVVLPNHAREEALAVAERIRHQVASHPAAGIPITASIGVATLVDDMAAAKDLLEAADKAAYLAKETGRNRVCAQPPTATTPQPPSSFVGNQITRWISRLHEIRARNGPELDACVEKIGVLLGRIFGADSQQHREFRKSVQINESPTCPHRLERHTVQGTDRQFYAEVYARALERIHKHLRPADVHRDFEPWDPSDQGVNP